MDTAPVAAGKRHYEILDGMRGIAAVLVMIYHYFQTPGTPYLNNTFIAVDFFFILSGFVIMHSYGARLAAGMPKQLYIARRLIRIYPLLAIGLLFGSLELYALPGTDYSLKVLPKLLPSTLLNLFFLPDLHSPVSVLMPADAPLWSVCLEMLASLAFVYLCRFSQRLLMLICAVSFCLIVAGGFHYAQVEHTELLRLNVGWNTLNFFGGLPRVAYGFCLGMLLYRWRGLIGGRRWVRLWRHQRTATLLIYGLWTACLLFPHVIHGLFFLLAITLGAPLLILAGSEAEPGTGALRGVTRFLGWISYPLYCLHQPVEWGVTSLVASAGLPPRVIAVPASLIIAALVAWLIDAPLRRWLNGRLSRLAL